MDLICSINQILVCWGGSTTERFRQMLSNTSQPLYSVSYEYNKPRALQVLLCDKSYWLYNVAWNILYITGFQYECSDSFCTDVFSVYSFKYILHLRTCYLRLCSAINTSGSSISALYVYMPQQFCAYVWPPAELSIWTHFVHSLYMLWCICFLL